MMIIKPYTCTEIITTVKEHPFNLRRGGAMVFFGIKKEIFHDIIFFLQKQYLLRHKVLTEYFFLPISETEFCFSPKKPQPLPPPPPFKLNGCSLITKTKVEQVAKELHVYKLTIDTTADSINTFPIILDEIMSGSLEGFRNDQM